jgi:hypothetical protein
VGVAAPGVVISEVLLERGSTVEDGFRDERGRARGVGCGENGGEEESCGGK